jgi:superfamily II RNA helicase
VSGAPRVPLPGEPVAAPAAAPASASTAAEGDPWRRFRALQAVLEEFGYVEGDRPTPAGRTAAALRTANELLLAEVIRSPALATAEAPALAGALSALAAEQAGPRAREGETAPASPTPAARALLDEIETHARAVRSVQRRHRADVPARPVDRYAGLIEAWAGGAEWETLFATSEIEEGDLVYLIRTLIDLLRQVAAAPEVAPRLRTTAAAAARALDREPVDQVL